MSLRKPDFSDLDWFNLGIGGYYVKRLGIHVFPWQLWRRRNIGWGFGVLQIETRDLFYVGMPSDGNGTVINLAFCELVRWHGPCLTTTR